MLGGLPRIRVVVIGTSSLTLGWTTDELTVLSSTSGVTKRNGQKRTAYIYAPHLPRVMQEMIMFYGWPGCLTTVQSLKNQE